MLTPEELATLTDAQLAGMDEITRVSVGSSNLPSQKTGGTL